MASERDRSVENGVSPEMVEVGLIGFDNWSRVYGYDDILNQSALVTEIIQALCEAGLLSVIQKA